MKRRDPVRRVMCAVLVLASGAVYQSAACSEVASQYTLADPSEECRSPYRLDPDDPTRKTCIYTYNDYRAAFAANWLSIIAEQFLATWVPQRLRVPTSYGLGT